MAILSKILSALEREYLRDNLREFEETIPMTLPERDALRTDVVEYEQMKEMAEER